MAAHPSLYYIKYLMSLLVPEAKDDKWVSMMVTAFALPTPKDKYLQTVRTALTPKFPPSYQPTNRYHRETVKFLRAEGIWGLHNPDEDVTQATQLLSNMRVRPVVEQLLLGRLEPREIAKKVNARFGVHFTASIVDAYSHYYWNVPLLRVEDWNEVFSEEETTKSRAMTVIQGGPAMALHMAGFEQRIESKLILRDMLESVYFEFRDWKTQPRSKTKADCMVNLSKAATGLDYQLSQADIAIKDALAKFEQFRMKQSDVGVVDIRDLAPSGEYTQSGAKLLEAPQPDSDSED